MPYLGGIQFPSMHKARQYHLTLLRQHKRLGTKCPPYKSVILKHHKDFPFLYDLFKLHPDWKQKTGNRAIYSFEFAPDQGKGERRSNNWCCYVVNSKGRRTKWSARHIGKSKRHRQDQDLRQVFRIEIVAQRDAFAAKHARKVHCAQCNCPLRNPRGSHGRGGPKAKLPIAQVDHDVQQGQSFIQSYKSFIQTHAKGNYKLDLKWSQYEGRKVQILKNRKLAQTWRQYHQEHSEFRFLCVKCNNQSQNKAN